MAQTITVDGVSRGSIVHREDCTWAEAAYLGETAEGQLVYHDDTGLVTAAGFKDVVVDQDACTPSRIMSGFVGKKLIKKGSNWSDYAVSREYGFSTKDGNDLLTRLEILAAGGNRSHETSDTVGATLHWLVDDELSRVGVLDHGAIDYDTTVSIDGTDRRGSRPGDVLAQLAKSARRNYYVRWHVADPACTVHGADDTDSWELVFRDDNTSTADTSTISISNAGNDDGETTFAPDVDPELGEDPEHIYSRMIVNYAKGREVVEDAFGTADEFVERDGDLEDTAIKKATTAARDGRTALWEAHSEAQLLPVTLSMRHDQVNLILPGQRVSTRMTHLGPEGWDPARYARVLRRKVTQPQGTDYRYKVALDLAPQEPPDPATVPMCALYDRTPAGDYWPLGSSLTSDGVVAYWRAGLVKPGYPWTGELGDWHFAELGAGGSGSIDYAGDCAGNELIFILIGNGTASIQTEVYAGSPRLLGVFKGTDSTEATGSSVATTLVGTISSGASIDVTFGDSDNDDSTTCIHYIVIGDTGAACGGKWGWSQMTWVRA